MCKATLWKVNNCSFEYYLIPLSTLIFHKETTDTSLVFPDKILCSLIKFLIVLTNLITIEIPILVVSTSQHPLGNVNLLEALLFFVLQCNLLFGWLQSSVLIGSDLFPLLFFKYVFSLTLSLWISCVLIKLFESTRSYLIHFYSFSFLFV